MGAFRNTPIKERFAMIFWLWVKELWHRPSPTPRKWRLHTVITVTFRYYRPNPQSVSCFSIPALCSLLMARMMI
eukprot:4984295-Prymnesium_polylepis.1